MKQLLCIAFIICAYLNQNHECYTVNPQIKATYIKELLTRERFININTYFAIQEYNKTYNNIEFRMELLDDLPEDVELFYRVTSRATLNGTEKFILKNKTYICRESNLRELLPRSLVVNQTLLNTNCLKKGLYSASDFGQVRFEYLYQPIQESGKYFEAVYQLRTDRYIYLVLKILSEWGYLKNY